MKRLRTWNERFRTRDSKERNLKAGTRRDRPHGQRAGAPQNVRETASVIYRRALSEDLLPGRSIEGRRDGVGVRRRAPGQDAPVARRIARVSRVEKMELTRTYRYIVRELGLEVAPRSPRATSRGSSATWTSRTSPSDAPVSSSRPPARTASSAGSPRGTGRCCGVRRLAAEQREGHPEPGERSREHLRGHHPEPVQGSARSRRDARLIVDSAGTTRLPGRHDRRDDTF